MWLPVRVPRASASPEHRAGAVGPDPGPDRPQGPQAAPHGTVHPAGCGKMAVMPSPRSLGRAFPRGTVTLTAAFSCAVAVLVAGCTSTASGTGSPPSPRAPAAASAPASRLDWHPCTVGGAALQCATLAVPLDYRHPAGRKITLALSMVPATAPPDQRQGDLLVNPGGPGASGRVWAAVAAYALARPMSTCSAAWPAGM